MKTLFFTYHSLEDYSKFFRKDAWIDFILGHFSATYSVSKVKARVLETRKETADSKTIVLQTNKNWNGFTPGQHIPVTVERNGRRVTRFYSLTSVPGEKTISITVKVQPGGLVSEYLNKGLEKGEILEIGQASGEFCVPENNSSPVLFIAGGSGITPVYSILRSMAEKGSSDDICLLYFCRTEEDIIFGENLKKLFSGRKNWKLEIVLTDRKAENFRFGFLTESLLKETVPDYISRKAFVCGPSSLKTSVSEFIPSKNLKFENFAPSFIQVKKGTGRKVQVSLLKSHRTVEISSDKPILNGLEEAGIYPPSGCRMGICHTCACVKKSGTSSSEGVSYSGEETVRICQTTAESDLELEL
ncbi:MAG TPA: ferredoxin reductase [Leptospiraceae bacterium]|nr:ferredoxin reductase [Leptospiraceae bacterium]